VFSGDETGEDLEATLPDDVVVIAASKPDATILHDPQPAALGAVLWIQLLEQHDAMRDALNLASRDRRLSSRRAAGPYTCASRRTV
jgi:hypothetical protein